MRFVEVSSPDCQRIQKSKRQIGQKYIFKVHTLALGLPAASLLRLGTTDFFKDAKMLEKRVPRADFSLEAAGVSVVVAVVAAASPFPVVSCPPPVSEVTRSPVLWSSALSVSLLIEASSYCLFLIEGNKI